MKRLTFITKHWPSMRLVTVSITLITYAGLCACPPEVVSNLDIWWSGGGRSSQSATWGWSEPSSLPSSRPLCWSGEPSPIGLTESSTTPPKLWKHTARCAEMIFDSKRVLSMILKVRAKTAPIKEGDTSVTYVPVPGPKTSVIRDFEGSKCQTMADVWDWSVRRCFFSSWKL